MLLRVSEFFRGPFIFSPFACKSLKRRYGKAGADPEPAGASAAGGKVFFLNKEKAKKILTNLLRYDKINVLFQPALRGMCRLKFLFEV